MGANKKIARKIVPKPKADVIVKREPEEVEKPELIDDEAPTGIVSTIRLEEIRLKDLKWLCKLRICSTLPRSYHLYKILMELDEEPYLTRIEDLERQIRGTLFENEKATVKNLDASVARVRKDLEEQRKECEVIQFSCSVEELKYKDNGTVITVRVPDDVIEAFNRQKSRLSYYKITLESL